LNVKYETLQLDSNNLMSEHILIKQDGFEINDKYVPNEGKYDSNNREIFTDSLQKSESKKESTQNNIKNS